VRWRNQLLALCCLAAFAALGLVYFRHWVQQKPFGIVLFIGHGLTPERIALARLFAGGANERLAIEALPCVALLSNYSNDFAVPDEAAAASSLATGSKVNNGALCTSAEGKILRSVIDLAREKGRATGLITNTSFTDPSAAAFYAHGRADDAEGIAAQLMDEGKFDIAFGGGGAYFSPQSKGGKRRDGRDLLLESRRNGFDVVRTKAELEAIPRWRRPKLCGIFSEGDLAFANHAPGGEEPSFPDMVRRAIELLQFNPRGYILVVDAGLMRTAAQANNAERTLSETLEFDRAVALARRYMGRNSLVIVAGDCGIGGLTLSGFSFRKNSGVALLGLNSSGEPSFTWATGPNGAKAYGTAKLDLAPSAGETKGTDEPAAVYAPSAKPEAGDVIAAGSGPGSEALRGFIDNTAIFEIVRDQL